MSRAAALALGPLGAALLVCTVVLVSYSTEWHAPFHYDD